MSYSPHFFFCIFAHKSLSPFPPFLFFPRFDTCTRTKWRDVVNPQRFPAQNGPIFPSEMVAQNKKNDRGCGGRGWPLPSGSTPRGVGIGTGETSGCMLFPALGPAHLHLCFSTPACTKLHHSMCDQFTAYHTRPEMRNEMVAQ